MAERKYLPAEDVSPEGAFQIIKERFMDTNIYGDNWYVPKIIVKKAVNRSVLTGFEYLALESGSIQIKDMGSTALFAMQKGLFRHILSDDLSSTMHKLGVKDTASVIGARVDEPQVVALIHKRGALVHENPMLVTPLSFLLKANSRPIEALATLTRCASEIRDILNGLGPLLSGDEIVDRSLAAESHYLHQVLAKYPETHLSPQFWNSTYQFPNGLSEEIKYTGITLDGIMNSNQN